ncbi:MAG: acyl carrier protein [Bacilli bacterium]|jgi:acyl carrier protein|nr:acyl carrier protein [Bacilli bacterium]HHU24461.1 acyl carrier protein [Acholeplasmataceae bacterium]
MTYEKVVKIIGDVLNFSIDDLTLDTHLQDDLGIDSLDVVELMMAMEDAFAIAIDDEEMKDLRTIGDIVAYLQNK